MSTFLKQIRIYQWTKNLLCFVPLISAHRIGDLSAFWASLIAFFVFGFCASATYVVNDLVDLASDRNHPIKQFRPIAAGAFSVRLAIFVIGFFLAIGISLSCFLPRPSLYLSIGYVLCSVLYSLFLKRIVLMDILVLAGLYTLRIFVGSAATGIVISEWLIAFSIFFFLSLALAKRFSELTLLASKNNTKAVRHGYSLRDIDYIPIMGICSTFATSIVMALYISSDQVRSLYNQPYLLWLFCPMVLYWAGRIWILCHRGTMRDDPLVFALKDPTSYVCAVLAAVILILAT